jgi:hypothetical protein
VVVGKKCQKDVNLSSKCVKTTAKQSGNMWRDITRSAVGTVLTLLLCVQDAVYTGYTWLHKTTVLGSKKRRYKKNWWAMQDIIFILLGYWRLFGKFLAMLMCSGKTLGNAQIEAATCWLHFTPCLLSTVRCIYQAFAVFFLKAQWFYNS